jgi:hypothetical protein
LPARALSARGDSQVTREKGMQRLWKCFSLTLIIVVVGVASFGNPQPTRAQEPVPVSVRLTGWGWCVAYRDIGDVVADLTGYKIPRDNATEIEDIYLTGPLTFNISGRSDSFQMELRVTKTRSLFFLKQVSVSDNSMIADMIAEFEGTWLGETDYVACEGRITIPAPNHVAKPYLFVLRTRGVEVPQREPGGWVGNIEFVIQKLTGAFDTLADEASSASSLVKQTVGDMLMEVAVIARDVRNLGIPYLP